MSRGFHSSWWQGTAAERGAFPTANLAVPFFWFETDTRDTYQWDGVAWLSIDVGGSGAANQVAYWTGSSILAGDAGLTYVPATDTLTAVNMVISGLGAGAVQSSAAGVISSGPLPLTDLADYTQGDLIYGGAADWQDLAHPGVANRVLQSTAAEVGWSANAVTFPTAGAVPVGSGAVNRVAYWSAANTLTSDAGLMVDAANDMYIVADGGGIGIGAALERVVFDAAGYVSVMGAMLAVGTLIPEKGLHVAGVASGDVVFEKIGTAMKAYFGFQGNTAVYSVNRDIAGNYSDVTKAAAGIGIVGLNARAYLAFYTSAVNAAISERMRITKDGDVGINRTVPRGLLHGYDAISGFMHWEFNDLAGVAQTVISNGAGDVTSGVTIIYRLSKSGGGTDGNLVMVLNGASVDLYDDGTDVCTLTVNADGSVTIVRSAGAATFKVALWLLWI